MCMSYMKNRIQPQSMKKTFERNSATKVYTTPHHIMCYCNVELVLLQSFNYICGKSTWNGSRFVNNFYAFCLMMLLWIVVNCRITENLYDCSGEKKFLPAIIEESELVTIVRYNYIQYTFCSTTSAVNYYSSVVYLRFN